MYLRTTKRRNKDGSEVCYYALAENVRHPEKGHVEARVVHSFGRADKLDRVVLERLVVSIRRVLAAQSGEPMVERTGDIEIEAVFELGVVHVAKALWQRLGIADAVASRIAQKKRKAPHLAALLAMVMQRLERPGSKLACHERWLERVWLAEAQDLALGQLYRALDLLAEHGDAIEREVFWNSVDLFKLDVDLVFYDATTAWFECDEEDVASHTWRGLSFEPLRKRGHSKEGRDNHPQEADDPSLEERASVDARGDPQVVIALAVTREGVPVRSWVFPGNSSDVTTVERVKDDLKNMRLGPYLSQNDNGRPFIDKNKIKRAEHLDGKFVLTTNDDSLSVADIALGYKGMWIIESCFKKMKTTSLEVRPMFHWMPHRITAHVKLCVLALMIQRTAEIATEQTWRQIQAALEPLKAVQYRTEDKTIVQTSKTRPEAKAILKKLNISKPKTILNVA